MSDATKTVKTDEAVHSELERLKQEHNVETFNAVLRRELGIVPTSSLADLTAYLVSELQETVQDIVEILSDPALVQHISEDSATSYTSASVTYLQFVDPETSRVLFEIGIDEQGFDVYYRSQKGEMDKVGTARQDDDGSCRYGYARTSGSAKEDVLQKLRQKADGTKSRWLDN